MKNSLKILSILAVITSVLYANPVISKFEIKERKDDLIKTSISSFADGIPAGFGSGIYFKEKDKNGNLYFYVISDRGPNGDGPVFVENSDKSASKFFPAPNFTPSIAIVKVGKDGAQVVDKIEIKANNKKITGLPIPNGIVGATNEIALSESLEKLGYDQNGLDTEAILVDKKGNFWISDEYGPFIANIDAKTGNILEKFSPGTGLPEVIKYRQANRGMEGLAINKDGILYGVVQSTLDINGETANTAQFLRVVEMDPKTKKTKMYAYPHDVKDYKKSKDAKIGDMASIGDNKFLIIEQGKMANKQMKNMVYIMDLSKATDITDKKINGKELEYEKGNLNIELIKKVPLLDLRTYGWEEEKAEGLAVIDEKTIAITSDNDFGIGMDVINGDKEKLTEYLVENEKRVSLNGQEVKVQFKVVPTGTSSKLWIIQFPKAISEYYY